jgi:hypothetical protein
MKNINTNKNFFSIENIAKFIFINSNKEPSYRFKILWLILSIFLLLLTLISFFLFSNYKIGISFSVIVWGIAFGAVGLFYLSDRVLGLIAGFF